MTIYVFEHAVRGRRILASAMPDIVPEGNPAAGVDVRVEWRRVPLRMRRQARLRLAEPDVFAVTLNDQMVERIYRKAVK